IFIRYAAGIDINPVTVTARAAKRCGRSAQDGHPEKIRRGRQAGQPMDIVIILRIRRISSWTEDATQCLAHPKGRSVLADTIVLTDGHLAFQDQEARYHLRMAVRWDLLSLSQDQHIRADAQSLEQSKTPGPDIEAAPHWLARGIATETSDVDLVTTRAI